jgi:cathepsin L
LAALFSAQQYLQAVMKAILVVALLVGLAAAFTEQQYQDAFTSWMHEHNRVYASHEFFQRYNAFKWNMDYVEKWNSQNSQTVLGLNSMADLSNEEYQKIYLGTKIDVSDSYVPVVEAAVAAPLASLDWRTSGAVTGVKNQGQCGSCWSFSSTGAIEGITKIKRGTLVSFSEQNLMDCSTSYGNQGCNGGLMTSAFKYVVANKGLDTESSYPYTAKAGTCHYTAANSGGSITSYKSVASGSESGLITAITAQPVSVAIDASHNSFQLYKSGIYYEAACSSTRLDHGVLAIGYGDDYFLVKNSWGTSWGQAGYIQMARNKNNNCGIATQAAYPTI